MNTDISTIVAFDIDGSLTDSDVKNAFNALSARNNITVGVVTANPPLTANSFITTNELSPQFQQSAIMKARALVGIGMIYTADRKIYVGNSITDVMYARISGWEFVDARNVQSAEDILEHNR